jgi:hypothetical protein
MIENNHLGPLPLNKPEIGRRSLQKRWSKTWMRRAYGDGYRATAGGSAAGRPTRSFSNEQRCACMASSAYASEGGSSPVHALGPAAGGKNEGLHTSSSDQDLFPPADIFRARRLAESECCELISGRGDKI